MTEGHACLCRLAWFLSYRCSVNMYCILSYCMFESYGLQPRSIYRVPEEVDENSVNEVEGVVDAEVQFQWQLCVAQ